MNPLKVCPQCGTEYPANARFCEIDGTALRSAGIEQDMVGSIISDRYCILKKLGEGGMGQVYLAEHVKMGRKSALKVMHPGMVKDVDSVSRFNREATNASKISHPNVAAVYDFGETAEGVVFLAMEFVDGPPLTRVIEQAGALPPKRAAEIVRQTAEGLAVAHDMGIVHRDLKPDNIMIAKTRDGFDLVKVVDFGIAKAAGSDAQKVTKTGLVVGTPEYMSPEQLAGDKLDGRSDIYSLGLVAFNMLTGTLPFPSDSAQESMIMRLTDKPKPLSEMRPEISWPADVQKVMDKALERDATLRYQTATEFGRDLVRVIERMPVSLAAEIGTQMMQVPATRVAEARPSTPIVKGTLSVPTPISSAPVTGAAAPEKKKSKVPLVGGIVVGLGLVVAAAIVVPPIVRGKDANAKNSSNSTSAINPTVTPTTQSSGSPAGGADSAGKDKPILLTKPGGSSSTAAAGNVEQQLKQLEKDATDSTKADDVLARATRLFPDLTTGDDKARGNYVRSRAALFKDDASKACDYIKQALTDVNDAGRRTRYNRYAEGFSCS